MKELDITEKQMKDAIDDAYKESGHNAYFGNGFKAGFLFAKKIAIATTNQASEEQNDVSPLVMEWVATSDRLPETNKYVIVWLDSVKDTDIDRIDSHTTAEEFKTHYSHWMQFPEPPVS